MSNRATQLADRGLNLTNKEKICLKSAGESDDNLYFLLFTVGDLLLVDFAENSWVALSYNIAFINSV